MDTLDNPKSSSPADRFPTITPDWYDTASGVEYNPNGVLPIEGNDTTQSDLGLTASYFQPTGASPEIGEADISIIFAPAGGESEAVFDLAWFEEMTYNLEIEFVDLFIINDAGGVATKSSASSTAVELDSGGECFDSTEASGVALAADSSMYLLEIEIESGSCAAPLPQPSPITQDAPDETDSVALPDPEDTEHQQVTSEPQPVVTHTPDYAGAVFITILLVALAAGLVALVITAVRKKWFGRLGRGALDVIDRQPLPLRNHDGTLRPEAESDEIARSKGRRSLLEKIAGPKPPKR